nr:hypothetical protein [Tanacetum cinerariifolium]
MATTIEQQVAMDEALVPSTKRDLYAGILGYSLCPSTLYPIQDQQQETHYFVYQVEYKNHKKSNEMYYPIFTKVIIHHFMSKDPSIPRRNKINWYYVRDDFIFSTIKVVSRHQNTQQYGAMLPIELTNDEIRNTKAYKEYYAFATGEAVPKPKASAKRKRSGFDTSITPPTATTTPKPTIAVTPKLTDAAKGKQPAKSLYAPSEVARTEAQHLKIVLRRSRQQTHISQPDGLGTDEGTGLKPGVPNVPTDESEEELSWNSSDDEYELYRDVNINQGRGLEVTQVVKDSHVTLTPINSDGQQESSSVSSQFVTNMLNPTSDAGMESIFATASTSVAPLPITAPTMTPSTVTTIITTSQAPIPPTPIPRETTQFAGAVSAIHEIVQHFMDQRINEAVQVFVRLQSDRLHRGSKRRREGKEPESASTLSEPTTRSASWSTTGSKSRQASTSESAFVEEPV